MPEPVQPEQKDGLTVKPVQTVAPVEKPVASVVPTVAPAGERPVAPEEVNPLDIGGGEENKEENELLESIVETETGGVEKKLLELAPEEDTSLLEGMEPERSLTLLILKIVFSILVVASVVSLVFFQTQLSEKMVFITSTFNFPNISEDLTKSNTEVTNLQTDLNFYRYIQANLNLNELSFHGDTYIQNYKIFRSPSASDTEKSNARDVMTSVRNALRESFINARDKLLDKFAVQIIDRDYADETALKTLFETELRLKLKNKADELSSSEDIEAKRDRENYMETIQIIGAQKLINTLKNTDFDSLNDGEIYELISDMNKLIVNDLSIVQEIKNKRIKWSDIIKEIERRTIKVDRYYTDNFYEDIGGVQYSNYEFDTLGRSITITGEIMRYDTTNFTMISNLIDELNRSQFFDGAEMKSFSKSGSIDTGYTSSLRISLKLKDDILLVNNDEKN